MGIIRYIRIKKMKRFIKLQIMKIFRVEIVIVIVH